MISANGERGERLLALLVGSSRIMVGCLIATSFYKLCLLDLPTHGSLIDTKFGSPRHSGLFDRQVVHELSAFLSARSPHGFADQFSIWISPMIRPSCLLFSTSSASSLLLLPVEA